MRWCQPNPNKRRPSLPEPASRLWLREPELACQDAIMEGRTAQSWRHDSARLLAILKEQA